MTCYNARPQLAREMLGFKHPATIRETGDIFINLMRKFWIKKFWIAVVLCLSHGKICSSGPLPDENSQRYSCYKVLLPVISNTIKIRSWNSLFVHIVKSWVVGCWHRYLSAVKCRFAYGPADATATHLSLAVAPVNPDWFYLPGFTILLPAHSGSPGQNPEEP